MRNVDNDEMNVWIGKGDRHDECDQVIVERKIE